MVGTAGLLSVIAGGALAFVAGRYPALVGPAHVEALETGAGFMLIAGFALASCALPVAL